MMNQNARVPSVVLEDMTVTQLEEKRLGCRSILREFCLNTTAHGLPGIARSKTRHNRIFWSAAFIIFTGIMIFCLVKAVLAYFDYPTNIDTSIISEWPQHFPAFSFCNVSPFRLDRLQDFFLNYSIVHNLTSVNNTAENQSHFQNIVKFIVNSLNKNESVEQLFYPLSSMMYSCTFNSVPCSASDFISFTSAAYGSCYTFNAKLRNITSPNILYANDYGGNGFGMMALVHDNTQLPLIETAGIELAPGRRHKLGYRKKATYFLSSPYTKCTDKVPFSMQAMFENYNNADYLYSEALCYQLCGQVYTYEQCGCVSPLLWNSRTLYIPSINRVIFADLCDYDNSCYTKAIGGVLTSSSLMNDYCSECSQECLIRNFNVQTSSLSAPADWEMEYIKTFVENSSIPLPVNWNSTWYEQIHKNYLVINVVRETSIVENNTQSAAIGTVDVLSNIGGQTGLWIGISFLSIMELIEVLYQLIRHEYYVIRTKIGIASQ
ncbi:unnamed protein product [Rotaria sp. Silwood2]|nr:unnamed protein product [Rotaria sp. Silwood2]